MKRLTKDKAYYPQEWEMLMMTWTQSMPRRLLFDDWFASNAQSEDL